MPNAHLPSRSQQTVTADQPREKEIISSNRWLQYSTIALTCKVEGRDEAVCVCVWGGCISKKNSTINIKSEPPLLCISLILRTQVYKLTDSPVRRASVQRGAVNIQSSAHANISFNMCPFDWP